MILTRSRVTRRWAAVAFGLAGCSLLAACGSSSATQGAGAAANAESSAVGTAAGAATSAAAPASSAAAPGDTTACTLVTETDAAAALGTDPGPASTFASHGSSQCQYGSYQTGIVLVNLTPTRGKAGYDLVRNDPKRGQADGVTDVAGVGDRAFEISGPHNVGIYFNKGDALILVSLTTQTASSALKSQTLAMAKTAASRV